jgi:hypothetical protein
LPAKRTVKAQRSQRRQGLPAVPGHADLAVVAADDLVQGFTTFCVKPSQFTDDPDGVGALCREVMKRAERFT